jgi:hypothetical protein
MNITKGHLYVDDNNDTWYIEKAPTTDSVGIATFVGDTKRSDGVIKLHVGHDGTLFAINGRLMSQVDNVIQFKKQRNYDASDGESSIEALFKEAIERNEANRERQEREKAKTNKSVLRSYRIKTKKD